MGSAAGCLSVACTRSGGARSDGARSDLAYFLDAARQILGPVQKVKGGEVVRAAVIVLPALAGPEEDAAVVASRGLAGLHIEMISMQGRFTRYGYSTHVGSKNITLRREAERVGELLEPAASVVKERTLCLAVICNRLSEIEVGGGLSHDQESESG